jgi:hypothetical protein
MHTHTHRDKRQGRAGRDHYAPDAPCPQRCGRTRSAAGSPGQTRTRAPAPIPWRAVPTVLGWVSQYRSGARKGAKPRGAAAPAAAGACGWTGWQHPAPAPARLRGARTMPRPWPGTPAPPCGATQRERERGRERERAKGKCAHHHHRDTDRRGGWAAAHRAGRHESGASGHVRHRSSPGSPQSPHTGRGTRQSP